MPAPRTLGAFADVKTVLDAALRANGGTYRLRTHGAAIKWRQRAYQYRKLLLDIAERNDITGLVPASTPYDGLELRIEGSAVIIAPREPVGEFIPASGPAINLEEVKKETEENEFTEAARKFADELRGRVATLPTLPFDPEEPAGD